MATLPSLPFGPALSGAGQCVGDAGFCFEFPLPHGFRVAGFRQSAPGVLWGPSGPGVLLRLTDAGLAPIEVGNGSLVGFDFSGPSLGYAAMRSADELRLYRFDGVSWQEESPPLITTSSVNSLVVLPDGTVALGGGGLSGVVFTRDAGTWTSETVSPTLIGQGRRTADGAEWLAGRDLVSQRDGGFSVQRLPGTEFHQAFFRAPSGRLWLASEQGLASGIGTTWTSHLDGGGGPPRFLQPIVLGSGDNDVWFAAEELGEGRLYRWNGTALSAIDAGMRVRPAFIGGPADALFVAHNRNQLVTLGPAGFQAQPWQGFDLGQLIYPLDGTAADDVWALADTGPLHSDGTGWRQALTPPGTRFLSYAFAVEARGVAWGWLPVNGVHALYRCTSQSGCVPFLKSRAGLAAHRVISSGGTTWIQLVDFTGTATTRVFRLTGAAVQEASPPDRFREPTAHPDGTLWAIDESTAEVLHLEDAGWVVKQPPQNVLFSALKVDQAGTVLLRRCNNGCTWQRWNGAAFAVSLRPDGGTWPGSAFSGSFPDDMWMMPGGAELWRVVNNVTTPVRVPGLSPSALLSVGGHVFFSADRAVLHRAP